MPYPYPGDTDWKFNDDELLAAYGYHPYEASSSSPYDSGADVPLGLGPYGSAPYGYGGPYSPAFPAPGKYGADIAEAQKPGGTAPGVYAAGLPPFAPGPYGTLPFGPAPYPVYGGSGGYGLWVVLWILLIIIGGGYYLYSRGFFP